MLTKTTTHKTNLNMNSNTRTKKSLNNNIELNLDTEFFNYYIKNFLSKAKLHLKNRYTIIYSIFAQLHIVTNDEIMKFLSNNTYLKQIVDNTNIKTKRIFEIENNYNNKCLSQDDINYILTWREI